MSAMNSANMGKKKSTTVIATGKSKAKKNTEKNNVVVKKPKKKSNLLKLCSVMNNYADDANDKEIIKRFKTTITSSVGEDISKTNLLTILKKPEDVKMSDFLENIQPYIKHYLFMVNRSSAKKSVKK